MPGMDEFICVPTESKNKSWRAESTKTELSAEELAAYAFVDTMANKASRIDDGFPLWAGWALREAFLAGIKYQTEK
jgi:hypothetical protein